MNLINGQLELVYDINEITNIINNAKKHKCEILDKIWEDYYKERCKHNFLTFSQFVSEFAFWNNDNMVNVDRFKDMCFSISMEESVTIPNVLGIGKSFGFTQFGTKIPKMICEACSCEGCPYLQEHLGYDCKICKKNGFDGYSGYCDE